MKKVKKIESESEISLPQEKHEMGYFESAPLSEKNADFDKESSSQHSAEA